MLREERLRAPWSSMVRVHPVGEGCCQRHLVAHCGKSDAGLDGPSVAGSSRAEVDFGPA